MANKFSPNPNQRKAVETTEGPVLIIAGPGSGKTFTLVERVFHLITTRSVAASNILVATFTEKAAQELVTRITNKLSENGIRINLNEMYIGTFHAICLRILKDYREFTRLRQNFNILDQFDQQYFLYQRIKEYYQISNFDLILGAKTLSRWHQSENLMKWVNKVSEENLEVKNLLNSENAQVKTLGACFALYKKQLEEENALDFSSIQLETLGLLNSRPEILEDLQSRLQYLMIDEYQDTNSIQEALIFRIGERHHNICVVGDDDQGLYRFRGATIRNILEFPQNFSSDACQQIRLETNYRSHPDIIRFYNGWMAEKDWQHEGKSFRYEKNIIPQEAQFPQLPTVLKCSGQDEKNNWHQEVYAFLTALKDSGKLNDWNQIAFLFKSVKNPHATALARYLEEKGIPVYSPRSNLFFEREEVRLMIGALIFLFPQFPEIRKWNDEAHLEAWDYYDSCFAEFTQQLRLNENGALHRWGRSRAQKHRALTENTDYGFSGLFYELLQFPLFSRFLDDTVLSGLHDSRPARNLALFSKLLNKFEYLHNITVLTPNYLDLNIQNLFNRYLRFVMDGGIAEYEDFSEYAPSGCVSFMTIHQAKGLEFPVVFVGSLDAVPRKQFSDLDVILQNSFYRKPVFEPLEETKYYDFWRLYYTAFSRAQNLLLLTCQEKTQGRGKTPSQYLADAYKTLPSCRDRRFDLDKLMLEALKEVNLKKEYSFTSHITLFENCARQYKFFKELEFAPVRQSATIFGMLVHQTIEDIHKAVLRGDEHLVNKDHIELWLNANYTNLAKRERTYLAPQTLKVAFQQVLNYVNRHAHDWSIIKAAEVDVSLVKDEYILQGTVDLIRGEGDTVEIVDFKSSKKLDIFSERDKLETYHRQLEVYAHLVEERTGYQVSKLHLYFTGEDNSNPYISFRKNNQSIDATIAKFDEVVSCIEGKLFEIKERPWKLCQNCDMRHYCDSI